MNIKAEEQFQKLLAQSSPLNDEQVGRLLAPANFDDWWAAWHGLQRIARNLQDSAALADLLPRILFALSESASPDRALINFERFTTNVGDPAALLQQLRLEPRLIEMLITLFAGSQFLSDILIRYPEHFERIKDRKGLAQSKSRQQFYVEASDALSAYEAPAEKLDALRRFQRWQILRIGASDLLASLDLQNVIAQLSYLANSVIRLCLATVAQELSVSPEGFAVIALGKLGGRELNYSSDIDLLFIANSNEKAFQRLGQRLIEVLTQPTGEGFFYRVDMRLRPWGRVGTLVPTVQENLSYLQKHARLWEKQAMLKARMVAGDEGVGIKFLQESRALILNLPKEAVRREIQRMKKEIETNLRRRGRAWGEVKGGEGSIRDVEFVTQYLQLAEGGKHPEVMSRNTLDALARLAACGVLPSRDYRVMAEGYIFLRSVEHHLQIMHYRQTHLLPKEPRDRTYLARRLGFTGEDAGAKLIDRYWQHSLAIREIYKRYVEQPEQEEGEKAGKGRALPLTPNRVSDQHLSRMDSSYSDTFSKQEIQHHAELVTLLNKDNPVTVEAVHLQNNDWRVTIVAYDYFGELSLICGLLFEYGFNILEGYIFTYEPASPVSAEKQAVRSPRYRKQLRRTREPIGFRRKIVDVFSVRSVRGSVSAELWDNYKNELKSFLLLLRNRQQREVQGELAKRVAATLRELSAPTETLLPVDIAVDNGASENYTVLRIDAPDTIGFLYELTNALALNGIYIARVNVSSLSSRVHDTLFVTDVEGKKITDPQKQRQLRAATVLVKHFTHLLPRSPNPESAIMHFREFVSQLFTQPDWPKELGSLERPEVLEALAKLLGVSDFLWNDFLRMQYTNLFPVLRDIKALGDAKSKEELRNQLNGLLSEAKEWDAKHHKLNEFKDHEMFRIDMRYIQGVIASFEQFATELSDLTEIVVESAFSFCYQELCAQFGEPQFANGAHCDVAVCALGKFGGREMGFASDIELMFIYEGEGGTAGSESISNTEFYEKLINKIVQSIHSKREGIFEIDLRLRPYGRAGSLPVSLESFRKYYSTGGPAWDYERQALVKLRPIAGNPECGRKVVAMRDACLYTGETIDIASMRAMRERQIRQLVIGGTVNAKFSPGALVDLEYLVQILQIKYGATNPDLRVTNTVEAMLALQRAGILTRADHKSLRAAHNFLSRLIEALRMVRGNAKDLTVPPVESYEFAFLARRLGYNGEHGQLMEDLIRQTSVVQEISGRLLA